MTDPFFITGPALISFSGGRTSAYMLWRILQAHGGMLPEDVHVTFANTGKEREETLLFVHECATRWGVRVFWLEWRSRLKSVPVGERFEVVGFNSAARNGEPFAALIASKKSTPNSVARWCTEELKVKTIQAFMEANGYGSDYGNVIGLRADEPGRVVKGRVRGSIMPLADAGITKREINAFWFGEMAPGDAVRIQRDFGPIAAVTLPQGFDLGLLPFEGNCDGCFLKARPKLLEIERTAPGTLQWWSDIERKQEADMAARFGPFRRRDLIGYDDDDEPIYGPWTNWWPKTSRFVTEYDYAELIRVARSQGDLFRGAFDDDPDMDSECGLWCGEAA